MFSLVGARSGRARALASIDGREGALLLRSDEGREREIRLDGTGLLLRGIADCISDSGRR